MGSGGSKTPNSVARSSSVQAAVVTPQKTIETSETGSDNKQSAYDAYKDEMNRYMNIPKRLEDVHGEFDGDFLRDSNYKNMRPGLENYVDTKVSDIGRTYGKEALQEAKVRFYRELREKLYGKPEEYREWGVPYERYTVSLSKLDYSGYAWSSIFRKPHNTLQKAAYNKWDADKYHITVDSRGAKYGFGVVKVEDRKTGKTSTYKPYFSKDAKVDLMFHKGSLKLTHRDEGAGSGRGVTVNGEWKNMVDVIKFKKIS